MYFYQFWDIFSLVFIWVTLYFPFLKAQMIFIHNMFPDFRNLQNLHETMVFLALNKASKMIYAYLNKIAGAVCK